MEIVNTIFGSVKELKESLCCPSVCLCVCPSGINLSKAVNLHLSLIGQSQVSLRSVSDQSQVSLSLRSVSGRSLGSLCVYFFRPMVPKILRLVDYFVIPFSKRDLFR